MGFALPGLGKENLRFLSLSVWGERIAYRGELAHLDTRDFFEQFR
jgi:hypothetical protein